MPYSTGERGFHEKFSRSDGYCALRILPLSPGTRRNHIPKWQSTSGRVRTRSDFLKGACAGYVVGVADALAFGPVARFSACVPNGVTVQQLIDITTNYLKAHPEVRQFTASSISAAALSYAFPC